jgi:hypothetical protein
MKKTLMFLFLFLCFVPSYMANDDFDFPLEDMLFFEKVILDFYAGDAQKLSAIDRLETRCRFRDFSNGLSCANLSILYSDIGDMPRAYTASVLAYKKEPNDSYYRNMFQNMAIKTGNLKDMQKRMGKSGEIPALYMRTIQACQDENPSLVIGDIRSLVAKKWITKEQLEQGIYHQCLKNHPEWLLELLNASTPNAFSYKKLLNEEKDNSHPYKDIWDISYSRLEMDLKVTEKGIPQKNLTKIWVAFKQSILASNKSQASQQLIDLQNELNHLKRLGGKNKILAESLELAIGLILKQDKEIADRASRLGIVW